ncbi:Uncharacterised protein [Shigella sonnei]|nr:Uncharacterised protein [Shigella sonnei]
MLARAAVTRQLAYPYALSDETPAAYSASDSTPYFFPLSTTVTPVKTVLLATAVYRLIAGGNVAPTVRHHGLSQ